MGEIESYKALITLINVAIVLTLPGWCFWHFARIKKFEYWSFEWWSQIIIVLTYLVAITAEVPALWARISAYYYYQIKIPPELYSLTTWDRWSHGLFYVMFFLLTWIFTKKRMPEYVKEVLS